MRALQTLFPKRYAEGDIDTLWSKIQKNGSLSNQAFQLIFGRQGRQYDLPESTHTDGFRRPMTQGYEIFLMKRLE